MRVRTNACARGKNFKDKSMIGFGENLGTGFPTMVAAWEKKFHTLPKLEDNLQINFTELTFSGMKNNGENTTAITSNKLTKRQQLIVAIIKQEPSISAKSIAEKIADMIADGSADKIAASTRTIETELAELSRMGIIHRVGDKNGGHREIIYK